MQQLKPFNNTKDCPKYTYRKENGKCRPNDKVNEENSDCCDEYIPAGQKRSVLQNRSQLPITNFFLTKQKQEEQNRLREEDQKLIESENKKAVFRAKIAVFNNTQYELEQQSKIFKAEMERLAGLILNIENIITKIEADKKIIEDEEERRLESDEKRRLKAEEEIRLEYEKQQKTLSNEALKKLEVKKSRGLEYERQKLFKAEEERRLDAERQMLEAQHHEQVLGNMNEQPPVEVNWNDNFGKKFLTPSKNHRSSGSSGRSTNIVPETPHRLRRERSVSIVPNTPQNNNVVNPTPKGTKRKSRNNNPNPNNRNSRNYNNPNRKTKKKDKSIIKTFVETS